MKLASVLAAVAVLVPGAIAAQSPMAPLSVSPAAPTAHHKVVIGVAGGVIGHPTVVARYQGQDLESFEPQATRLSMAGNKITISVEMASASRMIGFSPSPPHDIEVGPLPAGTYQVEMVRRLPDGTPFGTVGGASFTVSPRSEADPLWNHTDLWWDPNESGWGLSLVQHASGVIFATWYVYDADGKPTWYVVPEGRWTTPSEYHGPVYRTTGPAVQSFDPKQVTTSLAGSATFSFDEFTTNAARISFTIDGATVRRSIQRASF